MILLGDENQLPPIVKSQGIRTQCLYHLSLFSRLIKSEYKNSITLTQQGRARSEIVDLYRYKYNNLTDMKDHIQKLILDLNIIFNSLMLMNLIQKEKK